MKMLLYIGLAALIVSWTPLAGAQKPIYRCSDAGKVTYSHEPCVGAVKIDATPTRGADKWSGSSRKGAAVQGLEQREAFAQAVKPLTGMDTPTFMKLSDRQRLPERDRLECARLDERIPVQTRLALAAEPRAKAAAEVQLYQSRKQFNDLQC